MKNLVVLVVAGAGLLVSSQAKAATGDLRLSGACVSEGNFLPVQSFHLDFVTHPEDQMSVGWVGNEFVEVQVAVRPQKQGPIMSVDFVLQSTEIIWTITEPVTVAEETVSLDMGETAKFSATYLDVEVHCEATLMQAETAVLKPFAEDVFDAMVDTPRFKVAQALPNQHHCGVRLEFPLAHRSGLISDLAAALEVTTDFTTTPPSVEVEEYQGIITVRTQSQAWAENIILEAKDQRTSFAELIREHVFLGHPEAAANIRVLRCEEE